METKKTEVPQTDRINTPAPDEYLGIDVEVDAVIKDVIASEWQRNDPADNLDAWSPSYQMRLLAAALKTDLFDRVKLDPALFATARGVRTPQSDLVVILNRSYARAKTRAPIDEIERRVQEVIQITMGPDKDMSALPKVLADAIATAAPVDLDAFVTEYERRVEIQRIRQAAQAATVLADVAWIQFRGAPDEVQKARDVLAPVVTASDPAVVVDPETFESVGAFLTTTDPEMPDLFPGLIPVGVQALFHGEPRARKSLGAFEFALSGATGTAPFGLARFTPTAFPVLYVMEEDPRGLTRRRMRRLVRERCGTVMPDTLEVSVRKGINLDDPAWVERIVQRIEQRGARLLVLDAARRLSAKTDEGPQKVRELTAVLRSIITRTGCSIIIVHHDVKPARDGQDNQRSRAHRASGGDWFAASECPIHFERLDATRSLVFPTEYKFSDDPVPFTFECRLEAQPDGTFLVRDLVGTDTTTEDAKAAGQRGRLMEWLQANPYASQTAMKKAGFRWETLTTLVTALIAEGVIDTRKGRTKNSWVYFVRGFEPSRDSGTAREGDDLMRQEDRRLEPSGMGGDGWGTVSRPPP